MKTVITKLRDIRPAEYNPRIALKPGDTQYDALQNSLERFGLVEPLVVNKTTGTLISGHQRLNVLIANGVEEAEVVVVEMDEIQEKLLNIAINKIEGDWDYKKLESLFQEISADDIQFTGFTAEELDNLFDGAVPDFGEETGSETSDAEEQEDDEEIADKAQTQKEFNIFLSFPTKELAENWLKNRGMELEFEGTSRNITIRMEGVDYGTRD